MIPDYKGLFAQASGPGDFATIMLAGTAGFVVDAGLNAVGFLSPGYTGVTAATAALGGKKAWHASRAARKAAKASVRASSRANALRARLAQEERFGRALDRLTFEMDLHRQGIIDDAALHAVIDEILVEVRRLPDDAPLPLPAGRRSASKADS